MTLAALIRGRRTVDSEKVATATPATVATHPGQGSETVAKVATVAVANAPAERGDALLDPDLFTFAPPGDPANDDEALRERAAIMTEGNGWTDAQALKEARRQADRETCWRCFLRNAARVLAAPEGERAGLLARYAAEASRRYGEATGADMAASLLGWVRARAVH